MNKGKTLALSSLLVALAVGLYMADRYWIAPVASRQAHASTIAPAGKHPPAPDFSVTGIGGEKISLADYKGKVVMIDFWATDCGPCRMEIPGFVELQKRYRDQGFAIIGISEDSGPEPVREFYKEFRMNYPVALEPDNLDQLYGGIFGIPTTFVVGRDGRIYAKHVGAAPISVFEAEIKSLLAAKPDSEMTDFTPALSRAEDEIEVKTPEQVKAENNPDVPGVDISGLSAREIEQVKAQLEKQPCDCGCGMNALECRHKDPGCGVSRKMAKEEVEQVLKKTI